MPPLASSSSDRPLWPLPPGMRATRATRALAALYEARPDAALSQPEVEAALASAGAPVNKVTVYRLLDRFAAAGLLHKQRCIDRVVEETIVAADQPLLTAVHRRAGERVAER